MKRGPATLAFKQLQLAPLGAGDLIDRTVRLYRHHFGALVRASAPPVVVSAVGTVLWSVSIRSISATASEGWLAVYFIAALLGMGVYVLGLLAQLIVMGGASRNLVMHLLWGEPVTARLIYRSVRSRFRGLLGAAVVVFFWLLLSGAAALGAALVVLIPSGFLIAFAIMLTAKAGADWIALPLFVLLWGATVLLMLYVFFLVAGRVAYVPQVLMVEGRGVLDAIGRSAALARGNVRRLAGMFLFTSFAGYSAVMLLLVPLGWFAYLNGVNPFEMDATRVPAWYTISSEVIGQLAAILLAPVWMMGLSLLYVDERVRHEGYDIELLAAQVFGEMPAVPEGLRAPLAPAIAAPQSNLSRAARDEKPPGSILGL
ncbi:MAG: hypothetical protein QOJ70_2734 [Acidobacteriota bacterium]|nr:hypothetical protein [Acidobacteriota bacterium]MDT7808921.1 hypothetical protein [Acidobacteriota bacterium]